VEGKGKEGKRRRGRQGWKVREGPLKSVKPAGPARQLVGH